MGWVSNFLCFFSDKGGEGVSQFLILADKGRRGVYKPPLLSYIVYEQPLIGIMLSQSIEIDLMNCFHPGKYKNIVYIETLNCIMSWFARCTPVYL